MKGKKGLFTPAGNVTLPSVDATFYNKNIAVHRAVSGEGVSTHSWSVSHVPTGMAFKQYLDRKREAVTLAEKIIRTGITFTSESELSDKQRDRLREAILGY